MRKKKEDIERQLEYLKSQTFAKRRNTLENNSSSSENNKFEKNIVLNK